ncbi:DUF4188 domain-containing protein [Micromonospora sp. NBC_01796]|uniref:DUF4188 domain-containing protein n=1 Tax=Micromonospora sp. NBC_01796 TaxID=2975987 RepID=UPI002DDA0178|nr:DUF4188 domain-containing protein [Micromonospora sp. NBC_01796]WSA85164.1 DUF4188 domain-containing protein [Micromonospora sp. NBC_01796]
MRTSDFSAAPPVGQATAMFVGATRYRGPRSIVTLTRTWFKMVRQMRRMDGYRWHTVYYRFPFTLGTVAFFSDRDALLKFARSRHHRELMCWVTDHGTTNATGGYIRLYTAEPEGYTNGVWRAEADGMAHIPTFTPLSTENTGPPVHRA